MPSYEALFRPRAAKAFRKLPSALQSQVARKLKERLAQPRVEADRMRELPDGYRLKFRASGLRLVYQVQESRLIVLVLAIGPRDHDEVYNAALREYRLLREEG